MSTKQSHGLMPFNANGGANKPRNVQVAYGHDGQRVVLRFNQPINDMLLTVEQCEDMLKNTQDALDHLKGTLDGTIKVTAPSTH